MQAKVIQCKCKYWEDEELLYEGFQGQAVIIDGSPCCVECGSELEIKESKTDQSMEMEYNEESGINTRPTKLDSFVADEDGHTYIEVPIGVAVRLVAGAKKRSKMIRGKDQEKLIEKYGLEESESRRMKLLYWASEMDKFVAYMERFSMQGKLKKKYRKENEQ